MRQDLGGHNTKYGLLIDDTKNILLNDYADMRDRMYDDARQDYHYRIIVGDIYATNKNIMEYENWSPISADHHYLNPVGRQYEAEQDEKEIVNHATKQAGLFDMPPFSFRTRQSRMRKRLLTMPPNRPASSTCRPSPSV